jgi:hypothetical protein
MSRQKAADFTTINYDLSPFMPQNANMNRSMSFENESPETLREKLQIKSEALNLLGKQLELCNKEKIEYKRLIDTLYDKNLLLKKSIYFKENEVDADDENFFHDNNHLSLRLNNSNKHGKKNINNNSLNSNKKLTIANSKSPSNSTNRLFNDIDSEDYVKILKDLIKLLQKEKFELIQKYDDSQQQLTDARSDLRLLREQKVRQRVGTFNEGLTTTTTTLDSPKTPKDPKSMSTSYSTSNIVSNSVRESLIKEIELLREQKLELENDLRLFVCQKEEIEVERDDFKSKYLKLNEFLKESASVNLADSNDTHTARATASFETKLKTLNKSHVTLSIDEIISKNNGLSEANRLLSLELNKLKFGSIQPTTTTALTNLRNKSEIKSLFKQVDKFTSENPGSASICRLVTDLKLLVESLLESLNDKSIACAHQRKVNKMLASRIQDLEHICNNNNNSSSNSSQSCSFTANSPSTPPPGSSGGSQNFSKTNNLSPYSAMSIMTTTGGDQRLNLDEPLIPVSYASTAMDLPQPSTTTTHQHE